VSAPRIVIVGAALAGLRTVQNLRRRGSTAELTLVGDEQHPPYDRPPLSKAVLSGQADPQSLAFLDADAMAALDVQVRLGVAAVRLDLGARTLHLADGSAVEFDQAVIATGSSPRRLPGLAPLAGVHVLRTLDDGVALRTGLSSAKRVAVIGGGFIGAEVASAARSMGVEVTVIDTLSTLMDRGLGPVLGARMTELHRRNGVELRLDASVTGLAGERAVEGVVLGDGSVVEADLVLVGIGTTPNCQWLRESGLAVEDGVLCDQYLSAGDGVYAVGDVARWHNPRYGSTMRTEHWTSAGEQATALAATLAGTPTPCTLLPYVWSDQFGRRLQIFGRIGPGDSIDVVFNEGDRFVALAHRDGRLEGAVGYDAIVPLLPYRAQLMAAGT
jgi:NADPH-dependent 2,4-dienoyl-CoA reductase/sulfur reductase-like enzyme